MESNLLTRKEAEANINESRMGTVVITRHIRDENHVAMFALLKYFIPIDIKPEPVYPLGLTLRYTGYCEQFDKLKTGEKIPEYEVKFTVHTTGLEEVTDEQGQRFMMNQEHITVEFKRKA